MLFWKKIDWKGVVIVTTKSGAVYRLDIPEADGFRNIFSNGELRFSGRVAGTAERDHLGFISTILEEYPEKGRCLAIWVVGHNNPTSHYWVSGPIVCIKQG